MMADLPGEARPRRLPLVNPEHAIAALRELVIAWDGDDERRFFAALFRARELLNLVARQKGHH